MKYLYYNIIILTILSLFSCNGGGNKNDETVEQDTLTPMIKYLKESDSLEKEKFKKDSLNRLKADTLKKIKAFDNIYFRTNNVHFKDKYFLDNIPFQVGSSSYHKDLLYNFELRTFDPPGIDYEYKNQTINRLISIINIKYKEPKKISKFFKSEPLDRLFQESENNLPKPSDDNNLYINYEWIKGDVRVRLGHKIFYEKSKKSSPNDEYYRKMFIPIIQFQDLKIAKNANKANEDNDMEGIKNDGNKF